MTIDAPELEGASAPVPLPKSVKHVPMDGRDIYLVGTAHVSHQSVKDVTTTVEQVQPDTVAVELCQARYENIVNRDRWRKTNVVKIVREGKALFLLTSLIMTSFQKRLGKKFGITPGAEMIEGIELAKKGIGKSFWLTGTFRRP
jgi:pheromone shutdown protein TraB